MHNAIDKLVNKLSDKLADKSFNSPMGSWRRHVDNGLKSSPLPAPRRRLLLKNANATKNQELPLNLMEGPGTLTKSDVESGAAAALQWPKFGQRYNTDFETLESPPSYTGEVGNPVYAKYLAEF